MTVSRGRRIGAVAAAICGVVLFVLAFRSAGSAAVVDGVRRLGAGFIVVWLAGGARYLIRAVAWKLCMDAGRRAPIASLFAASVAGDAFGNITPFGFLASEPSKIVFLGDRTNPQESISGLALENLFYSAGVVAMLVAGTAALLLAFDVPHTLRVVSLSVLAGAVASGVVAAWIVLARIRVLSRIWPEARTVEDRVFAFVSVHPGRIAPILALEAAYHGMAIFEIWFAVALIEGRPPSLLTSFVLEYVNRTITVVFQFVPMWIGVDEAGTGLLTKVLGLGPAAGVSLALVRKARILAWTAIGLAFAGARGIRVERAAAMRERNRMAARGV